MKINEHEIDFKLDTGAAVTAIPSKYIDELGLTCQKTQSILKGAGNHELKTLGTSLVNIVYKGENFQEKIHIIDNLVTPLLGKPSITKLGLVKVLDEVDCNAGWQEEFSKLFRGLGSMETKVKIQLKEDVAPFVQVSPRRIAAARRQPLKLELQRMESLGVIRKVEEPTDWCSPCIVVPKKDGRIRVCIDFTKLNSAVKREYHPLPATDESLSMLSKAKVFSKLDANCGYWQLELDQDSQKLTTFITPFGRYLCRRLPFGISSAPEIFQREMSKVLVGLEGVICQMDDILICSKDNKSHQIRVREVLERLSNAGITLNADKCEFNKSRITFLGHVIDQDGIHADPVKINAIRSFPTPGNRTELKRFFGMVNYLGKFTPDLAKETTKLRELLKKDNDWNWNQFHVIEFQNLKKKMSSTPVLAPFSLESDTLLSTDASSYGLGAALLQRCEGEWRPVAFASRTLSESEKRYAQIEKEALAVCWASDKFHYYLAGRKFVIETDHKPLVAILGEKELSKLPLRVQRFRLKMLTHDYIVRYTPGPKLVLADALSRAPVGSSKCNNEETRWVLSLVEDMAISAGRRRTLQEATASDEVSRLLIAYSSTRWPLYKDCCELLRSFYTFRYQITTIDGLIFYGNRVFIPESQRLRILKEVHKEHQGENKCIQRAKKVVWWPGMTKQIRQVVKECRLCEQYRIPRVESLIPTPFPERPWWRLATDIFVKDGLSYLLVIDYFSRYIVVERLHNTESRTVCQLMEKLFCQFGVPNSIVSDNGPQFCSENFIQLMKKWDVIHQTSSPRYPQSNGEAERAVRTVKELMKKNSNMDVALCAYRDSPLTNGYSPAQLLFGRGLNSMGFINPCKIDMRRLQETENQYRTTQASNFNSRHRVASRQNIEVGEPVMVRDPNQTVSFGRVEATNGREVAVRKDNGNLMRRNRKYVTRTVDKNKRECEPKDSQQLSNQSNEQSDKQKSVPSPNHYISNSPIVERNRVNTNVSVPLSQTEENIPKITFTRFGRASKAPKRLDL